MTQMSGGWDTPLADHQPNPNPNNAMGGWGTTLTNNGLGGWGDNVPNSIQPLPPAKGRRTRSGSGGWGRHINGELRLVAP